MTMGKPGRPLRLRDGSPRVSAQAVQLSRARSWWRSTVAEMTQAEKGDAENGKEKGGEKEKEQRGVKRPIVPALVPESLQEVRRGRRCSEGPGRAWAAAAGGDWGGRA